MPPMLLNNRLLNNIFSNARLAGVFIMLLLLSGCARNPVLLQSTYQALPPHAEITSVPFYAQTKFQCGPATLAMVLNHQGVDTDVEELTPQVFLPERDGSVQPEMLATVRRYERLAYPIRGTMDTLLGHLAAGDPVVVMQNLSLPIFPMWHYAVAIGYDLPNETLILRSGEIERHSMSFSRFDATWARTERWGFVVAKPGTLPAGISVRNALEAISAYEETHGPRATLSSWQAFVKRHPTNAMGQFALGNALYADQQPDAAIEAFRRATELDPTMGAAWLNLGLVLTQLEAVEAAIDALTQAAWLEGSWQQQARLALDALKKF
ncbi:PA2778 family cysteine peptidase [Halovibrio sp. HP20-50]|uniref:PA2778 family cysteine peptidase n=1 Tax=Halovibrio sp. HP20-59 TaxID=3080275 RepID=UPI00294AD82C|nr:PA2778 family cysteine peptidase [Halovibrio sp. HP20-59]MEA2119338.1 PA2778 family cysteine peptidase [Halovibrio sp. HP20-59]